MNMDNSPTTSARDDSSINAPTPNILLSFSIQSPNLATYPTSSTAHAWTLRFSISNIVITRRIIASTSYYIARKIQAPHPT
jgi:hypothetical protein